MGRLLFTGLALRTVLSVAACTGTSSKPAASPTGHPSRTAHVNLVPPSGRLISYNANQIRFRYPVSWRTRHFDVFSTMSTSLVDLSTEALHYPTIRATISVGGDNYYGVIGCLRGPGLAGTTRQVQAVIDAASFART